MQLVFIIRLSSLCQCYIMHVDWFHILCCHPVSVLHDKCGLIWYFVLSPCVRVTLYMWIELILCVVNLCPCYIIHVDWFDTLCCHPVSVLHYTCGLIWYFVLSPCVSITSQPVHSNSGESSLLQAICAPWMDWVAMCNDPGLLCVACRMDWVPCVMTLACFVLPAEWIECCA